MSTHEYYRMLLCCTNVLENHNTARHITRLTHLLAIFLHGCLEDFILRVFPHASFQKGSNHDVLLLLLLLVWIKSNSMNNIVAIMYKTNEYNRKSKSSKCNKTLVYILCFAVLLMSASEAEDGRTKTSFTVDRVNETYRTSSSNFLLKCPTVSNKIALY